MTVGWWVNPISVLVASGYWDCCLGPAYIIEVLQQASARMGFIEKKQEGSQRKLGQLLHLDAHPSSYCGGEGRKEGCLRKVSDWTAEQLQQSIGKAAKSLSQSCPLAESCVPRTAPAVSLPCWLAGWEQPWASVKWTGWLHSTESETLWLFAVGNMGGLKYASSWLP